MVISVAILKAAKKGIRKTRLLSSVSLSYEQSNKYIEFLKARSFIEEHDNSFKTTQKGLELIDEFDSSSLIRNTLAT